jgi:hypothetical protein
MSRQSEPTLKGRTADPLPSGAPRRHSVCTASKLQNATGALPKWVRSTSIQGRLVGIAILILVVVVLIFLAGPRIFNTNTTKGPCSMRTR